MLKISIVVPVFNMIDTIEQTLSSIWNQNYSNLELIVMDGGSTDGTKEFLELHKDKINVFISEKDKGQYYAIQKGMSLATGEVVSWLNADDVYFNWTFQKVSNFFTQFPNVNWIAGLPAFLDDQGFLTRIYGNLSSKNQNYIRNGGFRVGVFGWLQQESMFFKRDLWEKVEGLNLKYKLAGDYELWTRFAKYSSLVSVNIPLAAFRVDQDSRSKRMVNEYSEEVKSVVVSIGNHFKFIDLISRFNVINKLLRLLIWKKQEIIFYSISKKKWIFKNTIRPISTVNFTNLLLEINNKNLNKYEI